jgi:hypothetical protein
MQRLQQWFRSVKWPVVGVVLFCILTWACLFGGPLHAQDAPTFRQVVVERGSISYEELSHDLGVTVCYTDPKTGQGKPMVFVRLDMPAEEVKPTAAHERKHVEQMGRFNNDCDRFLDWYNTPVGKLMSEAEAYMTGYCVAVSAGADPVTLMHEYTKRLSFYLGGGGVNSLQVIAAMNQYNTCPEAMRKAIVSDGTVMPGWQ